MNNNVKVALSFVAGAAVGVAASWFILKERFDQITNDEIASFKEQYRERMEEKKAATENLEKTNDALKEILENAQDVEAVEDIIAKEGYVIADEEDTPKETRKKPYAIKPDELGDEQYDVCVLTYYADGVLTNDWDEPIEDIEGTVGKHNLSKFKASDMDDMYVRNDELELDYEINKDTRRFVDIGPDDGEYDE